MLSFPSGLCGAALDARFSDKPIRAVKWNCNSWFWPRKLGFFEERVKHPLPMGGILDEVRYPRAPRRTSVFGVERRVKAEFTPEKAISGGYSPLVPPFQANFLNYGRAAPRERPSGACCRYRPAHNHPIHPIAIPPVTIFIKFIGAKSFSKCPSLRTHRYARRWIPG